MTDTHEYCLLCDGLTGRAGKGDDSLYFYDVGAFCEKCYDLISPAIKAARDSNLKEALECLEMARKEGREEVLELVEKKLRYPVTFPNEKRWKIFIAAYQKRFGYEKREGKHE